ncbi:hypothetical protein L3V77_05930 [Vibrio sp. DW001]|uniref:hypothetical protein n=1 Tax=Vibrio sp. DW001 TaxID=2912315 RepID=UPI0023AFD763|nr:hypothetical protein [Vibrio sp. DW001]WED27776.1 hypothetical protein L3V77_05930 [Vibrio sp. DW001]
MEHSIKEIECSLKGFYNSGSSVPTNIVLYHHALIEDITTTFHSAFSPPANARTIIALVRAINELQHFSNKNS